MLGNRTRTGAHIHTRRGGGSAAPSPEDRMSDEPISDNDPAFEELLVYLRRSRGFDFTGYKRTSLDRRVRKRMLVVGINTFAEYTDYLEVHPDEFAHLFNTILINVTCFFRDPPVWEYVREEVVPRVVAGKQTGETIRV